MAVDTHSDALRCGVEGTGLAHDWQRLELRCNDNVGLCSFEGHGISLNGFLGLNWRFGAWREHGATGHRSESSYEDIVGLTFVAVVF